MRETRVHSSPYVLRPHWPPEVRWTTSVRGKFTAACRSSDRTFSW